MNIKEEKKIEKNNIRQYAVRLETSDGVGTGFIYAPKEHEYIYVFTVFHVIYTWLEDSKLVLNYQENQIDCLYGEVDICIVDSFSNLKQRIGLGDEEYKGVKEDVAVLKIPKTYFKKETVFPENFLCMPEDSIKTDLDFVGYGYPDKKTIEVELSGKFQRWKKKESMLFCQAENINYPSFS